MKIEQQKTVREWLKDIKSSPSLNEAYWKELLHVKHPAMDEKCNSFEEALTKAGFNKNWEIHKELKEGKVIFHSTQQEVQLSSTVHYEPNTIGWWIHRIKDPVIRQNAIEANEKTEGKDHYTWKVPSLAIAIGQSIIYAKSPQGHSYWQDIQNNLPELLPEPVYEQKPGLPKKYTVQVEPNSRDAKELCIYIDSLETNPRRKRGYTGTNSHYCTDGTDWFASSWRDKAPCYTYAEWKQKITNQFSSQTKNTKNEKTNNYSGTAFIQTNASAVQRGQRPTGTPFSSRGVTSRYGCGHLSH